jgi:hypothetical protein
VSIDLSRVYKFHKTDHYVERDKNFYITFELDKGTGSWSSERNSSTVITSCNPIDFHFDTDEVEREIDTSQNLMNYLDRRFNMIEITINLIQKGFEINMVRFDRAIRKLEAEKKCGYFLEQHEYYDIDLAISELRTLQKELIGDHTSTLQYIKDKLEDSVTF